jgi:hypothetical protein
VGCIFYSVGLIIPRKSPCIHKDDTQNSKKLFHIIFPLCSNNQTPFASFEFLMQHHTNVHSIKFERKQLEFSTQEAFKIWKQGIEKESKSFYYLNATRSTESTLGKINYPTSTRRHGNFAGVHTLLRILLSSNSAVLINIITGVSPPHYDFVVYYVLCQC